MAVALQNRNVAQPRSRSWRAAIKPDLNATGNVKVEVKGPTVAAAEAERDKLFRKTEIQRSVQMPNTTTGPNAAATASEDMASR